MSKIRLNAFLKETNEDLSTTDIDFIIHTGTPAITMNTPTFIHKSSVTPTPVSIISHVAPQFLKLTPHRPALEY